MRRSWQLLSVLVVIVSLLIAACGGRQPTQATGPAEQPQQEQPQQAQPQQEPPPEQRWQGQTLVVTGWGGGWQESFEAHVAKPFQEKYGVRVELALPGSGGEILAKLRAEKDNPTMDVVVLGGGLHRFAEAEGLVEKLDFGRMSSISELYPEALSTAGDFGPAICWASWGVAYDSGAIPPPTSWAEMWNPAHKGKVAVYDVNGNAGLTMLWIATQLAGGSVPDNMEPGFARMQEFVDTMDPIVTPSHDATLELYAQKQLHISILHDSRIMLGKRSGIPVEFAPVAEGRWVSPIHANVVKNGPADPELAQEFINFWLSAEIQGSWLNQLAYAPVNRNARLSEETASVVVYGEEEVKRAEFIDWETLAAYRNEWGERLSRIFAGQ